MNRTLQSSALLIPCLKKLLNILQKHELSRLPLWYILRHYSFLRKTFSMFLSICVLDNCWQYLFEHHCCHEHTSSILPYFSFASIHIFLEILTAFKTSSGCLPLWICSCLKYLSDIWWSQTQERINNCLKQIRHLMVQMYRKSMTFIYSYSPSYIDRSINSLCVSVLS